MDGRDGGGAGEAGMGDPELNRRARRFTSGSRDHHKDACNGPRSRTEVHAGPGSGWGCLRVTDQMEGDMGVIFGFLPLLVSVWIISARWAAATHIVVPTHRWLSTHRPSCLADWRTRTLPVHRRARRVRCRR